MARLLSRVYPIIDTAALQARGGEPVSYAEALLEGGAKLVQFRHKNHFDRSMFETAEQIRVLCAQAGCTLVVNDRADIAALLDAGLHVGQEDMTPTLARRVLGPERILGLSTHNEEQLAAADSEPASYLAIGPVFATASKENPDPEIGLARLPALRRLTAKPLVAIGGITLESAPAVYAAGIGTIALIGALMSGGLQKSIVRSRIEEWLNL